MERSTKRMSTGWSPNSNADRRSLGASLLRLARPHQWIKGLFCFIGPLYGGKLGETQATLAAVGAFVVFGLVSSAGYVVNDLRDWEADRAHPRKRRRPVAVGDVSPAQAGWFAAVLLVAAVAALGLVWGAGGTGGERATALVALLAGIYVANVMSYSLALKHRVIIDVISLALGFVLRVLAGCAAVLVVPSTWLLNVTFFIAMFLAFGKRLGERRTMGDDAAAARLVQAKYTDELLRMVVVVTGVATLLTYAGYIQSQEFGFTRGFNLLWLTMLPATYGLLRCIVLLERGDYDDPTELAAKDRAFQVAVVVFVGLTVGLRVILHGVSAGPG